MHRINILLVKNSGSPRDSRHPVWLIPDKWKVTQSCTSTMACIILFGVMKPVLYFILFIILTLFLCNIGCIRRFVSLVKLIHSLVKFSLKGCHIRKHDSGADPGVLPMSPLQWKNTVSKSGSVWRRDSEEEAQSGEESSKSVSMFTLKWRNTVWISLLSECFAF